MVIDHIIIMRNIHTAAVIISRRNRGFGSFGLLQTIHVPFHSFMHWTCAVYLHSHSGLYRSVADTNSKHIMHSITVYYK